MEADIFEDIDMRRLGRELKKARNQRGLTQAESASKIGVSRTTMVAIEKGERRIKPDELVELARAYGRRVGEFTRSRPDIAPFQVQYRGPRSVSPDKREEISKYESLFEELCRDYVELENVVGSPLERDYPSEYQVGNLPPRKVAEEIASKERNRLGLGSSPLGDLRAILEEKVGLRIFYIEMRPSSFSEMYHYDKGIGGCIAVNKLHPPERRLWSLAHGYMHFLVHRYEPTAYVEGGYERLPAKEQVADFGALYLAMPTSEVLERYNKIMRTKEYPTPADLCVLANYFGVSVAAITRRLEEMDILPSGTWSKLKDRGFKVREAQEQLGIERRTGRDHQLPLRYQYLALEALGSDKISEGQFARFLRIRRLDARAVAEHLKEHSGEITGEELVDLDISRPLNLAGENHEV